jgi:hypothetical protein
MEFELKLRYNTILYISSLSQGMRILIITTVIAEANLHCIKPSSYVPNVTLNAISRHGGADK